MPTTSGIHHHDDATTRAKARERGGHVAVGQTSGFFPKDLEGTRIEKASSTAYVSIEILVDHTQKARAFTHTKEKEDQTTQHHEDTFLNTTVLSPSFFVCLWYGIAILDCSILYIT